MILYSANGRKFFSNSKYFPVISNMFWVNSKKLLPALTPKPPTFAFVLNHPVVNKKNHLTLKYTPVFLLLLLAFTVPACKSFRRAQGASLKPKTDKVLMKNLLENQVSADWFGGKAKITYSDEYGRETFSANIRIRKDSIIWMNFKKFSLEGARVLIRPDSIFVIDRLNGQYAAKPFEAAQREYNLPVGFQGLQAVLLGNPVFFTSESTASIDSSYYLLSQKTDRLEAKYWLDGAQLLLRRFFVNDFRNSRSMDIYASDYQRLEDKQNFSYVRHLNLNSPDMGKMNVEIEFSKVEINVPQKIEFEIPQRYEKVD